MMDTRLPTGYGTLITRATQSRPASLSILLRTQVKQEKKGGNTGARNLRMRCHRTMRFSS